MTGKKDPPDLCHGDTAAVEPVPSAPGTAETIPTASPGPGKRGARVELDQTIDSGDVRANSSGTAGAASPRVIVRGGHTEDFRDLVTVDSQYYVVGREIARGGMGRVMAARDRRLGRPVAIKELLIASGELRARFEREARITAKLQHPAIVNLLEAGTWPSGEPFYVMKLVTGESLDKVTADRPTIAARLALLPNVIAAVDALAYAHHMRVIHRDLKPANVLVGEFGETVVIDWGLAKDLADTSGTPDLAVGPYRTSSSVAGETQAGSIMGTPAYMPAEQALGDPVDERADVYALGAMLYHVLSGAPPYTAKTSNMILDAVIAGPPPPIDERTPGVPPDLVTIVHKAMAHAAADRYPTAKELADDLKKFQTGQLVGAHHYTTLQLVRRWIRRHRTPVAVGAVASLLLVVLGVVSLRRIVREQTVADEQRRVAEVSRGEAEDVMTYMVGDLHHKVQPLGRLDLLDDVANKVIAYYDRRGDNLSDAQLGKRALAQRNLGDVLFEQGHAADAKRTYLASLAIAEMLAAKDPSAKRQADLAISHEKVGDVLLAQGDAAGSLTEYRTSLVIRKTLAANEPTNADLQQALSLGQRKVGDVLLAQGDAPGALAEHRAALAISQTLAAKDPTNADRQRNLSIGHEKVGNVVLAQGDTAGALLEYRTTLATREMLVAMEPKNANGKADLAVSHDKVGNVLRAQGNAAGALAEYRVALAITETLAEKDPTNAARTRDLTVHHNRIGDVLRAQGDLVGALTEYRASLTIRETLAVKDPTNADRLEDLSLSRSKVGDVLNAQGDAAGALAEYRAALAISETLAANDPTNASRQRDLSMDLKKVGAVLFAQGNTSGALERYRAALAISETLVANDPTNADRQRDLSVGYENVGDVLFAKADAGALTAYRTSLSVREMLAAGDPTNANRQRDLSVGHEKLGDAFLAQGDKAGGLEQYRAALAISETLAAKDPTNADLQADLAAGHTKVGNGLLAKGESAGSLAEYTAALTLAKRLQARDPTNADVRNMVAVYAAKVATCCAAKRMKPP